MSLVWTCNVRATRPLLLTTILFASPESLVHYYAEQRSHTAGNELVTWTEMLNLQDRAPLTVNML
ncbi:uncharacterized protein FIBRA_08858 [Fibroporia radiculosa]|uniref:Uncharacterized protein n=1 Tax=Fibroporia radiculosa TaxID=599839 RepID=J4GXI7_9APHY|nr:uncharacterized protein FIBRA_08858 [Fibroporia radiculosa]CCM06580.1 predicted protein [Fibroporia radiculosa]